MNNVVPVSTETLWRDWIPLFQSLLWPALIGAIVYWLRDDVKVFLREFAKRVEDGDDFDLGKDGVKLRKRSAADVIDDSAVTNSNDFEIVSREAIASFETPEKSKLEEKNLVTLVHSAKRARDLDRKGYKYFRLRFWLDSETEAALDEVQSVTYELHESFKDPIRTVSDRQTKFGLNSAGWGEFTLRAIVQFKDGRPPKEMSRYINLPTAE